MSKKFLLKATLWIGLLVPLTEIGDLTAQAKYEFDVPAAPPRSEVVDTAALPTALPQAANDVPPLTLSVIVQTRSGAGTVQSVKKSISRSRDRVHVTIEKGPEWLFERNSVDPRRASALLIDHVAKAIIAYEESDLRNAMGIRGWAEILTLGVDLQFLADLKGEGRAKEIAGFRFRHFSSVRKDSPLREVWWNDELLLPSGFTTTDVSGTTVTFTLEQIGKKVDSELFRDPRSRFPKYRYVDLAEWLER